MESSALRSILRKKQPQSTEIEVHLFEYCNLSCRFCGQDHNSKLGFESVLEKSDQTIAFMKRSPLKRHIINVMGGEIFNDLIPDHLFQDYLLFANKIYDYSQKNNHEITINWVTNLIFKNTSRVSSFIKSLKDQNICTNISTSYDFEGRGYTGNTNSLFAKNLRLFKDSIYTIGFVLTKPAIKNLMEKQDIFFEQLYQEYPLYFDYYVPETKNSAQLMPSDQDLLNAFLYTAENYPKISPIKDWLKNQTNEMTCYSLNKITILPSGKEVTCRYLNYKATDFHSKINYQSNDNIISSYIDKNECLQCEFFNRCGFRCFVQADWVKREQLSECLYKTFFRTVEKKRVNSTSYTESREAR